MTQVKAEQDPPGGCADLLGRHDLVPAIWFHFYFTFSFAHGRNGLVSSGVQVESEHKFPRSVLYSHPMGLGGQFFPFLSSFRLL